MSFNEKVVLVAGGAGYIGTHTVVVLLEAGYRVIVVDDLSNSQGNTSDQNDFPPSLWRAKQITGKECLHFYRINVCDQEKLNEVFDNFNIDTVFDMTGRKAVGESMQLPLLYYDTNMKGTMTILKVMEAHGVRNFIFSSSCTVYGAPNPDELPVKEDAKTGHCHCPYGKTKYFIENLLFDLATSNMDYWRIMILRYFNPIGAHESGLIGEDPKGHPKNLTPVLAQVATGKIPVLEVYGEDYATKDGTPIRDYVHVMDVAEAHKMSIQEIETVKGITVFNIGSGHGKTTWDIVKAFEKSCGKKISTVLCPKRAGDVPIIYCDPTKAEKQLRWKAKRSIKEMCDDIWRFYELNPNGYTDVSVLLTTGIYVDY